jgi:hypothetical protein
VKLTMTRQELDKYVSRYDQDHDTDDALVHPDSDSPSGWSVYVQLNHWDTFIPIIVEG